MKLFRTFLLGAAALLATVPAMAAVVVGGPGRAYVPNIYLYQVVSATPAYSNATTTYTDIAGATVLAPATRQDYTKQAFRVCLSADVTKATSTTGTIQIVDNGTAITASRRTTSSSAGQNTIAECYTFARSDALAHTIKLQGVSGDTAAFTVANAMMEVWNITLGG